MMVIESGHAHAYTRGKLLSWHDYFLLLHSALECKNSKYKSLTIHIPYEIQHKEVRNVNSGQRYISFGELVKRALSINLYWENAPWLDHSNWGLKYGNTDWDYIPKNIDLCLDTGHLMLGCPSKQKFLKVLKAIFLARESQIKLLHLHENNLVSDDHDPVPGKIITKETMDHLTRNTDYVIEKPWL